MYVKGCRVKDCHGQLHIVSKVPEKAAVTELVLEIFYSTK